jgi:hypothetical protein
VPPVFSHGGAFCAALPVLVGRRETGEDAPEVSFGFSGELEGVEGRAVDGEPCLMEPGRPKGDWREPRALLKKSGDGDGLSVGADCGMSVSVSQGQRQGGRERERRPGAYHDVVSLGVAVAVALLARSIGTMQMHHVWAAVLTPANRPQQRAPSPAAGEQRARRCRQVASASSPVPSPAPVPVPQLQASGSTACLSIAGASTLCWGALCNI